MKSKEQARRDIKILSRLQDGATLKSVADEFDLSVERIRGIALKRLGDNLPDPDAEYSIDIPLPEITKRKHIIHRWDCGFCNPRHISLRLAKKCRASSIRERNRALIMPRFLQGDSVSAIALELEVSAEFTRSQIGGEGCEMVRDELARLGIDRRRWYDPFTVTIDGKAHDQKMKIEFNEKLRKVVAVPDGPDKSYSPIDLDRVSIISDGS